MRVALEPYHREYVRLIRLDASMDIKGALKIFKYFHLLSSQSRWGVVPGGCTCRVYVPNCVCRCTLHSASLFNPDSEVHVPVDYIEAIVSDSNVQVHQGFSWLETNAHHRGGPVRPEDDTFEGRVSDRDHAVQVTVSPRS
jgi:hypothetical protein